jgi:putative hydrolase of the HAD superfamily
VTNNAREFRESWTRSVPLDEICHHVVDSSEVGVRKPDARIFEIALERLGGIDPARAIFVDDFEANVAAAQALGMRGVWMRDDYAPAIGEIEKLLA